MGFKVSDRFKWPVIFHYAIDGKYQPQKFTAIFKRLPADEFARLLQPIEGGTTAQRVEAMIDLLEEIFVDFEEVEHDGSRDDVKRQLIHDTTVSNALLEAYTDGISGGPEKNSKQPLST